MNRDDLKEYLEMVFNMEKNIYLMETISQKLSVEFASIEKPRILALPEKPAEPRKESSKWNYIGAFVLLIIGIGCFYLTAFDFWALGGLVGLLLIFFAVIVLFLAISNSIDRGKFYQAELKAYGQKMNIYQNELTKYTAEVAKEEERVAPKRKAFLQKEFETVNSQLASSRELLKKLYAADIIFPKYRNMVMVASLYEYISAGRCDSLDGRDGAYNILEMEIRLDKVIIQLDKIIRQLCAIQSNQFMLYSAIQDVNQQTSKLLDSSERLIQSVESYQKDVASLNRSITNLQKTSALTAYCAERTEQEIAYMNRMNYFAGKYDDAGMVLHRPPS